MKNIFILFMFISLFSCGTDDNFTPEEAGNPEIETPTPPIEESSQLPEVSNLGFDFSATDLEGWNLVWEDNFDNNLSEWNAWNSGAFNEELQKYQPENLHVQEGYLYIEQQRESAIGDSNPFDSTVKTFDFTSGRIESKAVYSPSTRGTLRIAARIKLPAGEGLWPAFWSFGDPWPTQGEIDIMEFRGGRTNEYVTNFFFGLEANTPLTNSSITSFTHNAQTDLTAEFHVFDMVWTENSLIVSLDGVEVRTFTTAEFQYIDDLFNKSEKLVLNMAVGGVFFNGMNLNVSEIPDTSYMIVDWVRVYNQ